jgi:hypothetical protein
MSAKSVVSALTGFLAKHVGDLTNLVTVMNDILSAVPIDPQDKARIGEAITAVQESANNINDWLQGNTVVDNGNGDVVVKESDIVEALGNFFASDAGKAALASALNPIIKAMLENPSEGAPSNG